MCSRLKQRVFGETILFGNHLSNGWRWSSSDHRHEMLFNSPCPDMSEEKPRQEKTQQTVVGQVDESYHVLFVKSAFCFSTSSVTFLSAKQKNKKKTSMFGNWKWPVELFTAVTLFPTYTKSASHLLFFIKRVAFLKWIFYAHRFNFHSPRKEVHQERGFRKE